MSDELYCNETYDDEQLPDPFYERIWHNLIATSYWPIATPTPCSVSSVRWLMNKCKGANSTYFRALEIALTFMSIEATGYSSSSTDCDPRELVDSCSEHESTAAVSGPGKIASAAEVDLIFAAFIIASRVENELDINVKGASSHTMEAHVMKVLEYNIYFPTSYQFLLVLARTVNSSESEVVRATSILQRATLDTAAYAAQHPAESAADALGFGFQSAPLGRRAPKRVHDARDVWEVYTKGPRVGKGSFGTVYSATDLQGGRVAVKRMLVSHTLDEDLLHELSVGQVLPEHPNLSVMRSVHLIIMADQKPSVHAVFDFAQCDLLQFRKGRAPMLLPQVAAMTSQILAGLSHIHAHGFVHGDVKTNNVLVFGDTLKISDIGTASSFVHTCDLSGDCTIHTRSPEAFLECVRDHKIDTWAVGCIIVELATNAYPFWTSEEDKEAGVVMNIVKTLGTPNEMEWPGIRYSRTWPHIRKHYEGIPRMAFRDAFGHADGSYVDILHKLLTYNPDRRLSAEEALKHPFLYTQ